MPAGAGECLPRPHDLDDGRGVRVPGDAARGDWPLRRAGVLGGAAHARDRRADALGANAGNVRAMVLRQVGVMTAIGGVIGIAGALGLGTAAKSLLYQLQGYDPVVFVSAAALLTLVAFGAGFLPALRASRVDPMNALRYE